MDINEQVRAAFQVEHKEHIEGIRSLLGELGRDALIPGDVRLDEAFRFAHSLKGGARVCDLRPAEEVGHQLESLFASVRQGTLAWQSDVEQVVNHALDFIEDWMAALAEDESPPDMEEALAAIRGLLDAGDSNAAPANAHAPPTLAEELLTAFGEEYATYVDGLRNFLAAQDPTVPASASDAEEAFRHAHSLHSAAHAADLADVETLGQEVVESFSRLLSGEAEYDEAFNTTVSAVLDRIDAAVQEQTTIGPHASSTINTSLVSTESDSPTESDDGEPQAMRRTNQKPPASMETVRVETGSLDRLIHCSGQLMSEVSGQDELAFALGDLGGMLESMRRDRESVRQMASASLHRLGSSPEFGRVVRYLDTVDRQLETLTRRAQQLRRLQHRHQWQLRSRGEQIHHAARQARMVPVENIFQGYRKLVRDLAKDVGKQIEFTLRGLEHRADRLVLQALKDPLMHVLRNAVVHGVETPAQRAALGKPETGAVELAVEATGNCLRICASDDGRGVDWLAVRDTAVQQGLLADGETDGDNEELTKLVFEPGFTTAPNVSELAGRGMGLSVLHAAVKRLQGNLRLHSSPGEGTRVELAIPLSVSTHRMVLVCAGGQTYAVPTSAVERLLRVPRDDIETLEGMPFISYQQKPIPLVGLASLLGADGLSSDALGESLSVVIVKSAPQLLAVAVDALLAERDAMLHDLTGPAAEVPHFSSAVLLSNGDVALVLDPAAIVEKPSHKPGLPPVAAARAVAEDIPPVVLVVDDSFTTRTLEKSILEAHGYRVQIAVDGAEALSLLRSQRVDLVMCDVEMPRMDGFELLEKVKADDRLKKLPFILVTSRDKVEDREVGLKLGADAYIVKQKFDHQDLLDTIGRVL